MKSYPWHIHLYLSDRQHEELQVYAAVHGTTIADLIRRLVDDFIENLRNAE